VPKHALVLVVVPPRHGLQHGVMTQWLQSGHAEASEVEQQLRHAHAAVLVLVLVSTQHSKFERVLKGRGGRDVAQQVLDTHSPCTVRIQMMLCESCLLWERLEVSISHQTHANALFMPSALCIPTTMHPTSPNKRAKRETPVTNPQPCHSPLQGSCWGL
jgi:hypothetical protein